MEEIEQLKNTISDLRSELEHLSQFPPSKIWIVSDNWGVFIGAFVNINLAIDFAKNFMAEEWGKSEFIIMAPNSIHYRIKHEKYETIFTIDLQSILDWDEVYGQK
jgi:hypothetical protein